MARSTQRESVKRATFAHMLAFLCGCSAYEPALLTAPRAGSGAVAGGGGGFGTAGDAGGSAECDLRANDVTSCGVCGRVCVVENGEAACVDGACFVASCKPAFGDCDGDPAACETRTNTLQDCGGCHIDCRDLPRAIATCDGGTCAVASCEPGYGDCDRNGANGCETALNSLSNCGGCNVPCAEASCSGGVCTSLDCSVMPGLGDCNGDGVSCETDLRTDADNCGSCRAKCELNPSVTSHGTVGCGAGVCAMTCDDGYLDCDDDYRTGCEAPARDTDEDGAPDCQESCISDPGKQVPGVCGCGIPETDRDADGTPDCKDSCPSDPTLSSACLVFAPSNFDPKPIDFSKTAAATLNCGTTTINTATTPATITNWCGTAPQPSVQTQIGGPNIVVIALRGLTLSAGATLKLVGTLPVAFAVRGDVVIAGTLDASASAGTPGAGGNWSCGTSSGKNGTGERNLDGGGGGGGGFGTVGGSGGDDSGSAMAGGGGAVRGNVTLVPLFGGCGGGQGGGCAGIPGAGGGSVQISASGALRVSGTIRVDGGAGAKGCGNDAGGTGGGSGGSVLLESAAALSTSGATMTARGGQGGDGQAGGNGGNGSAISSAAGSPGENGSGSGGGGGGGGYGRIHTALR